MTTKGMRMTRKQKLFKEADDLNRSIFGTVESWLDVQLTEEGDAMTTDDVEDNAQVL